MSKRHKGITSNRTLLLKEANLRLLNIVETSLLGSSRSSSRRLQNPFPKQHTEDLKYRRIFDADGQSLIDAEVEKYPHPLELNRRSAPSSL